MRDSKSGNSFCCKSCAATFNNRNKTHGTRRSKLEVFIESQLRSQFPTLDFETNSKTIGSELDFYFPSLKKGLEINGIFHYQPIYGEMKLQQIQKNDLEKLHQAQQFGIELIVYKDESKRFTKKKASQQWEEIKILLKL